MFDSNTNTNTTNLKINAVSGIMLKNYRKSFMLRFERRSSYENMLFSNNPRFFVDESSNFNYEKKPVVVLQVMILPDNHYLAEIMWKKDFDEMFNVQGEES